jgi:hypothetical protein
MTEKELHKKSYNHRASILSSVKCGCFHCLAVFPKEEIQEWTDWSEEDQNQIGHTAICPKCGIDSIIGDSSAELTEDTLLNMKEYWFNYSHIFKTVEEAE